MHIRRVAQHLQRKLNTRPSVCQMANSRRDWEHLTGWRVRVEEEEVASVLQNVAQCHSKSFKDLPDSCKTNHSGGGGGRRWLEVAVPAATLSETNLHHLSHTWKSSRCYQTGIKQTESRGVKLCVHLRADHYIM